MSLHCFNWTKDCQVSLILLSINMSSILSLSNCSSLSQPSYQHLFNLSLPCNSEIVLDHQSTISVSMISDLCQYIFQTSINIHFRPLSVNFSDLCGLGKVLCSPLLTHNDWKIHISKGACVCPRQS